MKHLVVSQVRRCMPSVYCIRFLLTLLLLFFFISHILHVRWFLRVRRASITHVSPHTLFSVLAGVSTSNTDRRTTRRVRPPIYIPRPCFDGNDIKSACIFRTSDFQYVLERHKKKAHSVRKKSVLIRRRNNNIIAGGNRFLFFFFFGQGECLSKLRRCILYSRSSV